MPRPQIFFDGFRLRWRFYDDKFQAGAFLTYVRAMVTNEEFGSQAGLDRSCLEKAEARARDAYSEPDRCYHDERHLDRCLALLGELPDLENRDRQLLRWALLWHDSVYQAGLRNNEERSALLAFSELSRCGVAKEAAAEVARLVRLTEHHDPDPDDRLGALIVSIDLSILGSDAGRYHEYSTDVRREYDHVPDQLWRSGRAEVLKRLLAADPLFPDPDFQARFKAQARRNMKDELRQLDEG
jgi:predicted metal-dependent HD superfamily phosphohydrolase